jgi:glucokinase
MSKVFQITASCRRTISGNPNSFAALLNYIKSIFLFWSPKQTSAMHFLGIEIGGTKLQLVVADKNLNIIQRFRYKVDQSKGAAGIQEHIRNSLSQINVRLNAIGVGFGGPIDRSTGKIFTSYHIKGWTDFSLRDWLQQVSGIKVVVDNDANAAALGEARHGAGKNLETVFYVTLGSGVGAGLVQRGSIYHGAIPGETEFGHVRLDKAGTTVQGSCSGWAVDEKIRNAVKNSPQSLLATLTKDLKQNEATVLGKALEQHDALAVNIFESTMDDFAFGLSHAIHLFHPDIIVLGGGLSLLGDILRSSIEKNLKKYLMDAFQSGTKIELSLLKEDAVTVGAIAMAMQHSG